MHNFGERSTRLHLVNNETTHPSIEIHQTTISIQHLKWDTISESLLHYLFNYMEQGIPLYTPFSKRSAAGTALNKVLQHVASTHEPGTAVEIYPLTNNPYIRLYPKVTKYQIHGLLLQLQCLKTCWGGKVVFKMTLRIGTLALIQRTKRHFSSS